jgi:hypothetical protein
MMYIWAILGPLIAIIFILFGFYQQWRLDKPIPNMDNVFYGGRFSWKMFFSSLSGLAVIIWSEVSFIISMYYGQKYNKKTGRQF